MVGNKQKDWIKYLTQVQLEYNGAIHATTGFSPYYLVFGQPISLSMDLLVGKRERREREDWSKSKLVLLDNIRVATERIKTAYDKAAERWNAKLRHKQRIFKEGDEVLIWRTVPKTDKEKEKHKKLISAYEGPYRVLKRIEDKDTYVVQRIVEENNQEEKSITVSILRMKRFVRPPAWLKDITALETIFKT